MSAKIQKKHTSKSVFFMLNEKSCSILQAYVYIEKIQEIELPKLKHISQM